MKIDLTSDEAYFLEKLCDDQQGLLMRDTSKFAEFFFLLNAQNKEGKNDIMLKAIVKKLEEEARTTLLLDGLRKKLEELRNKNEEA